MHRCAFLVTSVSCLALSVAAYAGKGDPKPIDPAQQIKPASGEGYFDDVFGLDAQAKRVAVVRTDGASFSKLEVFDLGTGKAATSFDLPGKTWVPLLIELGPEGKGLVLVAREKPDDLAPVFAFAFDAAGKQVAKVGPAMAFGRPPADGSARAGLLIGYERKAGAKGAEATYTISPFDAVTLAPSGKPRVYKLDVAGEIKGLGLRFIGFYEGYSKILAERPGAYDKAADVRKPPRMAIVDALSGKVATEAEIKDLVGWAVTGQLRRNNPGRSLFVDLNQDASGVDVVDAMGKKQPATLAVPFELYDIKSLHAEEGPAPGGLSFGLGVDPLNPEAIKRQKADLPMLDVYTADATSGTVKHRGRVFIPRPVTWRMRGDKLVVLKRFKSFSRGGDELQVYDLR